MAHNDFEKGTHFLFLPYGYNHVRIPSNLRWGSFKLIFMAQNNFEEGENFWWQRRKSCQSLLCLSETRWCPMFLTLKKKKTMSIIHLQRRKLPMDAHLAPLILSNAPKLLTSKHFQRITKGKQELYEKLFNFSTLRISLSLSLLLQNNWQKWNRKVELWCSCKVVSISIIQTFFLRTPLSFSLSLLNTNKRARRKRN